MDDEVRLGTALGLLYDAVLKATGRYGLVMRCPSPTGETWIGWRPDRDGAIIESPVKLPFVRPAIEEAINSIVRRAEIIK